MSDYNREVEAEILGVVEDASATIGELKAGVAALRGHVAALIDAMETFSAYEMQFQKALKSAKEYMEASK